MLRFFIKKSIKDLNLLPGYSISSPLLRYYVILSAMLRFSFLFLLLVLSKPAFPQENYVALITNPEIGATGNAQNLLEAVDSINQISKVSHVVVLGNITAKGIFDEFIWAQEILDGLIPPYSVVGGKNDYALSEGRGSEISLLWGDNKNFISNNSFSMVCLNTIIPEFPNNKFIASETLNWFEEKVSKNNSSRLITFSFNPISSTENSFVFYEKIANKKIFSFVSKSDDKNVKKSVIEGLYLNRNKGWGYSLIKIKSDSLFIENIITENTKKREAAKITFTPVTLDMLVGNDSRSTNPNIIWEKNYNRSTITRSIYSNGKIYQGFKNGSIECTDELGNEKWDYQSNGRIYSSPIIEKDLLVVATNEGDLLTLNANTGSLVQVIGIGETITSEICVVDIKEDGGTTKAVVVGTANGNLYCYNLYTLEPMWINQSANDGISNRIISSIACTDNKVIFQDFNGLLYCVSAVNGLLLWYWKPPVKNTNPLFKTDINIKVNNIYVIDGGGNFRCIDALLGTEKWGIKNIDASGLITEKNKSELIITTNKNKLLTVSTKLGKIINEFVLTPEAKNDIITDFLLVDDKIITGFSDGSIYDTKPKQKPKLIFKSSSSPIVSLIKIESRCLVVDYNGNLTFISISNSK